MLPGAFKAFVVYPLCERIEGRRIRNKLSIIRDAMAKPFEIRKTERRRRIAEVYIQAGIKVPYYRDLFRSVRFDPNRLAEDARWLEDLPLLSKDIIVEQGERMLAVDARERGLHVRKTGGSTGRAATFFYSTPALDWSAAAHLFAYEWAGKRRHHSEIHLSSQFPEPFPMRDRVKEWCKCFAMNRVNVATSAFSSDGLEAAWTAIQRAKPELLQGHPSTLYALALHLRVTGRRGHGTISRFWSTGETLDPHQRRVITDVIGCPIFDSYGNAEIGTIAQQRQPTEDAALQVLDAMVWPEAGEGGEIIVTSLTNRAMPLLRYQTGDLATLEERDDGFFLSTLRGRVHDTVTIAGTPYPTHYVQDLLDRIGGIDEFQVMEPAGRPLLLRLVVPDIARRAAVAARIAGWWSDAVETAFIELADLQRAGKHNKFRHKVTV